MSEGLSDLQVEFLELCARPQGWPREQVTMEGYWRTAESLDERGSIGLVRDRGNEVTGHYTTYNHSLTDFGREVLAEIQPSASETKHPRESEE